MPREETSAEGPRAPSVENRHPLTGAFCAQPRNNIPTQQALAPDPWEPALPSRHCVNGLLLIPSDKGKGSPSRANWFCWWWVLFFFVIVIVVLLITFFRAYFLISNSLLAGVLGVGYDDMYQAVTR